MGEGVSIVEAKFWDKILVEESAWMCYYSSQRAEGASGYILWGGLV